MIEKKEDGSIVITMSQFTKVQRAFAIYWDWLHVIQEKTYYSEYSTNSLTFIKEIVKEMSEDEKLELRKKAVLLPPYIFNTNKPSNESENVFESDINAMKIYLQLGYPISDALSTFCSVFKDNEASKKRYEVLKKYIEEFDKNKQK